MKREIIENAIASIEVLGEDYNLSTKQYLKNSIVEQATDAVLSALDTLGFEDAAGLLMQYIAENHHPYTTAIVVADRAEIVESIKCHATDEFIVD